MTEYLQQNGLAKQLLTLPAPIPDKEIKINLNFYFHTFLLCLKRFYEGLKCILKKNFGEQLPPLQFFFLIESNVLEKLVNNRFDDHLKKCGLLSDFQCGFRSSRSTADSLANVSNRIAGDVNRSGATRAVALEVSKAFDRVCPAGLLHKLKS